MKCPICGSNSRIIKNLFNPEQNETYRLRHCTECNNAFFSVEFDIEDTDQFKEEWRQLLLRERSYYRQINSGRDVKRDPN